MDLFWRVDRLTCKNRGQLDSGRFGFASSMLGKLPNGGLMVIYHGKKHKNNLYILVQIDSGHDWVAK